MSPSDIDLSIFFWGVSSVYLIPSILLALKLLPSTVYNPALGLADRKMRYSLDICPSRYLGTSRHTEIELLPIHLWEQVIVQHVHTPAGVLPGNLPKIQSQDMPSFLYASNRCLSRSDH
jgi:hypothetical protein